MKWFLSIILSVVLVIFIANVAVDSLSVVSESIDTVDNCEANHQYDTIHYPVLPDAEISNFSVSLHAATTRLQREYKFMYFSQLRYVLLQLSDYLSSKSYRLLDSYSFSKSTSFEYSNDYYVFMLRQLLI